MKLRDDEYCVALVTTVRRCSISEVNCTASGACATQTARIFDCAGVKTSIQYEDFCFCLNLSV